jgi:flagellar M-ring protein FliF
MADADMSATREKVTGFFASLKKIWAKFSTLQRVALIGLTVLVLVGVSAIALVGSHVRYGLLYSELSQEDAGKIVEKLDAMKVPYQLAAGGTVIEVPEEKVHALRLELAKTGLPRGGGIGMELFDKSQIGSTEFEQQVNLRRALEGEIARTIATVEGVQSVRVHLVMPERRLFVKQEDKASASVVLKLKNPDAFGKREVAAIVHLVVAAVPGLSRDRVSIVSAEGVTLHRPLSDANGQSLEAADIQAEQSRNVGVQIENNVKDQLERVVGPGNADVRVSVNLDSSKRERTEEHYDKEKTALRSEQETVEMTGTDGASVAGVPGARSNLDDGSGTAPPEENLAQGPGGGILRRSHTRNWEVDRVTEKTTLPSGDVERLTVAVLLNGRYETRGDGTQAYIGRSKDELTRLEQIVKTAVGFNEKRGDSIKLDTMEFVRPELEAPPVPRGFLPKWAPRWAPYALGGAVLLFFVLTAIVVKRRARKAKKISQKALQLAGGETAVAAELLGRPSALELPPIDAAEAKERALEMALRDPSTSAIVLKKWLNAPATPSSAR